MIGFWVVNLLIPEEPDVLHIDTPTGQWLLDKNQFYAKSADAILNKHQCASTYAIQQPVSMQHDGADKCSAALAEMTPLMLGASYLTGLSVTANRSIPHSDAQLLQPSDHWPRERSMGKGNPVVTTSKEFKEVLELFVNAWAGPGQNEKMLLLAHHWLDSLACWSFEDLYLSATTLLQIIAATEEGHQGKGLTYFNGVTDAAKRAGIRVLSGDFKDMRNNLVHEGKLTGGKFKGSSLLDCAEVAADILNWFDEYVHAVLGLGVIRRKRFSRADFMGLNAYSLP